MVLSVSQLPKVTICDAPNGTYKGNRHLYPSCRGLFRAGRLSMMQDGGHLTFCIVSGPSVRDARRRTTKADCEKDACNSVFLRLGCRPFLLHRQRSPPFLPEAYALVVVHILGRVFPGDEPALALLVSAMRKFVVVGIGVCR